MKKQIQIILILLMVTFMTACQQEASKEHGHTHNKDTKKTEGHEHHKKTVVSLNDGKRWKANPETTDGINNMAKVLTAFGKDKSSNYKNLQADLEKELGMIFQKCTMKGEAHNQLHNYLLPMKKLFPSLTSESPVAQKETFDKLSKHLGEYPKYFE